MCDEHFTFTGGARLCYIAELRFLVLLLKLKTTTMVRKRTQKWEWSEYGKIITEEFCPAEIKLRFSYSLARFFCYT